MVIITLNTFGYLSRKRRTGPFLKYRVHRNMNVAKKKTEVKEEEPKVESSTESPLKEGLLSLLAN